MALPPLTRREILSLSALAVPVAARAQYRSMASNGVTAAPRSEPSGRPYNAKFTNIAHAAGLTTPTIYGDENHVDFILGAMGCGAAFIDYDNDGWQDIVILTGRRRTGPTPPEATIRLYHNNRDGTFKDITAQSGLGRSVWAVGITVGDYDNDGFDDIFITCQGQNILFHNDGKGVFTDVTEKAGLLHAKPRYGTGCTWVDYDRDGKLDLFIGHYLEYDETKIPIRGKDASCNRKGVPVFCGPGGVAHETFLLYKNNGNGTFTNVSESAGVAIAKPGYPLGVSAADFDNDGWPDIYVACDTSPALLFHNNKDGTFSERALQSAAMYNEDGREQGGMGLGIGDFDTDGSLDIFKTHFSDDTNILYRNNGKGHFTDVTARAGLAVETRYVGWGAGIEDFDNDGLPDIFYTTGMVYPEAEKTEPAAPYKSPNVLFRNLGNNKFEELDQVGPAMKEVHSSRGLAFGDFDNDGDIDILVINLNEPPSLLRNDVTGSNHWLKVQLIGTTSNRSAIGAHVLATYGTKTQAKAVMAQSSYLSANDRRLHFGLGAGKTANIEIRWPNGAIEKLADVPANQLIVVEEGKGIIKTDQFSGAGPRPAAASQAASQ